MTTVPTTGVAAPALLEALPDVVVVVDAAARIVYVNPAIRTLLGHEPAELRGRPLTVLVPGQLRAAYEAGFAELLDHRSGRPARCAVADRGPARRRLRGRGRDHPVVARRATPSSSAACWSASSATSARPCGWSASSRSAGTSTPRCA